MQVSVFSAKPHDRRFLAAADPEGRHDLVFLEAPLRPETARLAEGVDAVCPFVNDDCGREVLTRLVQGGTRLLVLRSAGFNHVDVAAAGELGLTVARVPRYSPHAVAEHAVGLILALNRKIHRAYQRVRESNFSLHGLLGFDLVGRTVGVVGTGAIGEVFARIMAGFGCELLGHDPAPSEACEQLGMDYVALDELFARSDIVSLHCPLTDATRHLVDARALERMRDGVMLINTGRGALVDTPAVVEALKSGRIGHLGIDVYEEEAGLFFEDRSDRIIRDDVFMRLLTFPNVIVTGHQGFFTEEALTRIAETTVDSLTRVEEGRDLPEEVLVGAP